MKARIVSVVEEAGGETLRLRVALLAGRDKIAEQWLEIKAAEYRDAEGRVDYRRLEKDVRQTLRQIVIKHVAAGAPAGGHPLLGLEEESQG
jgi:hypothetical protein